VSPADIFKPAITKLHLLTPLFHHCPLPNPRLQDCQRPRANYPLPHRVIRDLYPLLQTSDHTALNTKNSAFVSRNLQSSPTPKSNKKIPQAQSSNHSSPPLPQTTVHPLRHHTRLLLLSLRPAHPIPRVRHRLIPHLILERSIVLVIPHIVLTSISPETTQ
jgi:hypothetical protein